MVEESNSNSLKKLDINLNKINSKKDFIKYKYQILPQFKAKYSNIQKEFVATSNSIFVGEFDYPNVNLGILSAEAYDNNDNSKHWIENNWSISKIAESRFSLINSRKKTSVYKKESLDISSQQEIALSKKPVQINVELDKVVSTNLTSGNYFKPIGPSADLKKIILTENPKISTKIEKVISDGDLKSVQGLNILYNKNVSFDKLTQVFTSGSLGVENDRKLVPTKWGITAVDDIIGKNLIDKIKNFSLVGNIAFSGSYLGNYFIILFFEGPFSFELFEFFKDSPEVTTDYENIFGRKKYAENCAGGYYAARISALEWLMKNKKQGQVLMFRFITDEYYMPLGVWVVRNAVKETLENKKIEFGSEELMIQYSKLLALKKFNRNIDLQIKTSKIIINKAQKNLFEVFD